MNRVEKEKVYKNICRNVHILSMFHIIITLLLLGIQFVSPLLPLIKYKIYGPIYVNISQLSRETVEACLEIKGYY